MLRVDCATNEHGGEKREDVRLKEGNTDLEDGHNHEHEKREDRNRDRANVTRLRCVSSRLSFALHQMEL